MSQILSVCIGVGGDVTLFKFWNNDEIITFRKSLLDDIHNITLTSHCSWWKQQYIVYKWQRESWQRSSISGFFLTSARSWPITAWSWCGNRIVSLGKEVGFFKNWEYLYSTWCSKQNTNRNQLKKICSGMQKCDRAVLCGCLSEATWPLYFLHSASCG